MSRHRSPDGMRRFYDWFHRFYGIIERNVDASIPRALTLVDPEGKRFRGESVLDLCCGSGSLGLALAGRCASYRGRDQSLGMLERARSRWAHRGLDPEGVFELQNVLEFDDDPGTADRIILSFALHLFPAGQELELLKRCARAAGKGVIVIDHPIG